MQTQTAFVIAISGPSAAGKTTRVERVAAGLGDAAILACDIRQLCQHRALAPE